MTKLSEKFEPMDIIAMVMIVGCVVALIIKPDPTFKEVLLIICGVYFGRQTIKK